MIHATIALLGAAIVCGVTGLLVWVLNAIIERRIALAKKSLDALLDEAAAYYGYKRKYIGEASKGGKGCR
jgi:hypothetical protein